MEDRTLEIIRAGMRADPTIPPGERGRLIALLKAGLKTEPQAKPGPRVMSRGEAARTMGRSLRFIDSLARRGLLRRVKMSDRTRAIGVRGDDVLTFIEGNTVGENGKVATK